MPLRSREERQHTREKQSEDEQHTDDDGNAVTSLRTNCKVEEDIYGSDEDCDDYDGDDEGY